MGKVKAPPTTDDEMRQAIEAGQLRRSTERRAAAVRYEPDRDSIEIELTDGAAVRLPRAMVREFRGVAPTDMAKLRISPAGYGIRLDDHDINVSVHGLIATLATKADIPGALGKLRGAARSEAKRATSSANGAKGARPKKISRIA